MSLILSMRMNLRKRYKADDQTELIHSGWKALFGVSASNAFKVTELNLLPEKGFTWKRESSEPILDIWINLRGEFEINDNLQSKKIPENTITLMICDNNNLSIQFEKGKSYTGYYFQIGKNFIAKTLPNNSGNLNDIAKSFISKTRAKNKSLFKLKPLMLSIREFANSLQKPPVLAVARTVFYQAKAQELLALTMFDEDQKELFCSRQKRTTFERISKIKNILREKMVEPPSLKEIAVKVGCSPYYLSRTFSKETGMTIPQFLKEIRIEKAAELLRTGQCNVTEAAFNVGYNSPSHFSQAFCQKIGICPGMYPKKLQNTK